MLANLELEELHPATTLATAMNETNCQAVAWSFLRVRITRYSHYSKTAVSIKTLFGKKALKGNVKGAGLFLQRGEQTVPG